MWGVWEMCLSMDVEPKKWERVQLFVIILGLGLGITFQQVGNNCLSLDDAKREVEVSGVFFRDFFFLADNQKRV